MKKLSIVILFLLTGCKYGSYDECLTQELQKFQYEPSFDDRISVQNMCEIKNPYERQLVDVDFKWHGEKLTIDKVEQYNITKINIYAFKPKSGECDINPDEIKKIKYIFSQGGNVGFSVDWQPEYTCYFPKKSEIYGIRKSN
ncbi:hypothetical protein [Vibrio cholerae]|uniref:hypothetical protein n=1 Tax=Vibrio cholerae TaxID=666 RepID=UPI001A9CBE43|nr:hypothetical protein [Vibrio cholerae]